MVTKNAVNAMHVHHNIMMINPGANHAQMEKSRMLKGQVNVYPVRKERWRLKATVSPCVALLNSVTMALNHATVARQGNIAILLKAHDARIAFLENIVITRLDRALNVKVANIAVLKEAQNAKIARLGSSVNLII